MTLERLRELHDAQPFHPFTMHLSDGRAIPVVSREFIAAAPSGRTWVVFQPDDRMQIIDLLLVTDLELNAGNGKKKRSRKKRGS